MWPRLPRGGPALTLSDGQNGCLLCFCLSTCLWNSLSSVSVSLCLCLCLCLRPEEATSLSHFHRTSFRKHQLKNQPEKTCIKWAEQAGTGVFNCFYCLYYILWIFTTSQPHLSGSGGSGALTKPRTLISRRLDFLFPR